MKHLILFLSLISLTAFAVTPNTGYFDKLTTNNPATSTVAILKDVDIQSTGGVYVPSGTTAQRPAPTKDGMLRYNSTTAQAEIYKSGAWSAVGGGGISLWLTSTDYILNDVVIESNRIYKCITPHTSGTFLTDIVNWVEVSQTDMSVASGTLAIINGGTGATTAAGARTNLNLYSQDDVNSLINGSNLSYFLSTVASDIGGYFVADGFTGGVQSSTSASITANPTLIKAFATLSTEPNTTILKNGIYNVHVHAAKTAGTKGSTIYAELYNRTSGGVETLFATSEMSPALTGSIVEYNLHLTVGADITVNSTDRIVIKIYGVPSGAGTDPTDVIYMEGDTASRVELFITTQAYDTRYLVKGGLAGGQIANGGNAASENLTLASTLHATKGKILFGDSTFNDNLNLLGIGNTSPTHKLDIKLPADNNTYIDARTNPRTITSGVLRIDHTPATSGTRALSVDLDMNGYPDSHTLVTDYKLTGLSAGEHANNILSNYDTADSTGGEADAFSVGKVGTGTANVTALHAGGDINVIRQTQGTTSTIDSAWNYNNPTYTAIESYLSSGASNYTLFNTISDVLYIGHGSTYSGAAVVLATPANTSVLPTFEYWSGAAWTSFSPIDGTNGFTVSGNISWTISNLSGWATTAVNGTTKYWIRVTRTKASVTTKPIESTIKVQLGNTYFWDKNGAISAASATVSGQLTSTVATGTAPLVVSSTTPVTNLSIGGNAATVTTNANLTGDVTSVGNATTYSATVPLNKGGTGQTTKAPAFDALQPMTTAGDTIIGGASGTGTRLAVGSSGQYLQVVAGAPAWTTGTAPTKYIWSGYHDNDCLWAVTNTTYAAYAADATCTFTEQQNVNFGTVTSALSAGNKLPGIVFTPGETGKYFVCATISAYNSATPNSGNGIQLLDNASAQIVSVYWQQGTAGNSTALSMCGIVNITALTSQTWVLQGRASASANTINGASTDKSIYWTIYSIH